MIGLSYGIVFERYTGEDVAPPPQEIFLINDAETEFFFINDAETEVFLIG